MKLQRIIVPKQQAALGRHDDAPQEPAGAKQQSNASQLASTPVTLPTVGPASLEAI